VAQSKVDGALMLDPTPEEAHRQQASTLLAHMPLANQVPAQDRTQCLSTVTLPMISLSARRFQ
jgi:hypothetical protein